MGPLKRPSQQRAATGGFPGCRSYADSAATTASSAGRRRPSASPPIFQFRSCWYLSMPGPPPPAACAPCSSEPASIGSASSQSNRIAPRGRLRLAFERLWYFRFAPESALGVIMDSAFSAVLSAPCLRPVTTMTTFNHQPEAWHHKSQLSTDTKFGVATRPEAGHGKAEVFGWQSRNSEPNIGYWCKRRLEGL